MKFTNKKRKEIMKVLGNKVRFLDKNTQHKKSEGMRPVSSYKMGSTPKRVRKGLVFSDCGKKKRYDTQHRATEVARKIKESRGVVLRSYYCDHCKGYHLTKSL